MKTKRQFLIFTIALALPALTPSLASAQSGCINAYGRPVATIFAAINDSGQSTNVMGQPVIYLNPAVWQMSSPAMRLFIYGHECGHHALNTLNESLADCYGARMVVAAGYDITEVVVSMSRNPNSDWTHAPGPMRAAAIQSCVANSSIGIYGAGRTF